MISHLILLHSLARADGVAIAVDIIDTSDGGPKLEIAKIGERERCP